MKIAVLKERRPFERRVAATPETVKKFIGLGASVTVETGAGDGAFFLDDAYQAAGATITSDAATALNGAEVILKVRRPLAAGEGALDELALLTPGQTVLGLLDPYGGQAEALAATGVSAVAMEFVPRITRAQVMDVLSSQANLAGYKAVIEAASVYAHGFPMMMTAAGTVPPAKVLVMGAGVAGLQAIATARRLGGVVSATDVRPATKEQVESLGASFVAVIDEEFQQAQTAGGYAKEMSAAYKEKQAALIAETIKKQDIVICTALIPDRKAPTLVTAEMVASMKPGSVIVDLAVEQGGNCELSEYAQTVVKHGVSIIGHANMPSLIATDASALYARNLLAYLTPLIDKETKKFTLNEEDEIVKASLIAKGGALVHPSLVKPAA